MSIVRGRMSTETPIHRMVEIGRIYWGYPGYPRCQHTRVSIWGSYTTFDLAMWMTEYNKNPDAVVDASRYEFEFEDDNDETLMLIRMKYLG
jgi:hypothetical protein